MSYTFKDIDKTQKKPPAQHAPSQVRKVGDLPMLKDVGKTMTSVKENHLAGVEASLYRALRRGEADAKRIEELEAMLTRTTSCLESAIQWTFGSSDGPTRLVKEARELLKAKP